MIEDRGKHYLYRHIRLDKNEPFYIGVGTKCDNIDNLSHKRSKTTQNRNKFWKRIEAKTEYKIDILFYSNDYNFILQKEIEFIALYGRRNLNKGTLCNLTDGGEGMLGYKQSEETKLKKSIAMKKVIRKPEHIEKSKHAKRKKAEERGFWITGSEKRKGVPKPNHPNCVEAARKKCSIRVKQFTITGEHLSTWDSMNAAERFLINKTTGKISMVCNGKRPSAYGFVWRFENDEFAKYQYKPRGNPNIVEINKRWKQKQLKL